MSFSQSACLVFPGEYVTTTRMPIRASFMQMASPRPPIPPVTSAMRCAISLPPVCLIRRSETFLGEAAGRGLEGLVLRVAELLARGHELAAVSLEPLGPLCPPTSRLLLGFREPLVLVSTELVVHPVA